MQQERDRAKAVLFLFLAERGAKCIKLTQGLKAVYRSLVFAYYRMIKYMPVKLDKTEKNIPKELCKLTSRKKWNKVGARWKGKILATHTQREEETQWQKTMKSLSIK